MAEIEYIKPANLNCVVRVVTGEKDPFTSREYAFDAVHAYMSQIDSKTQAPRWQKFSAGILRWVPPSAYLKVEPLESQVESDLRIMREDPETLPAISLFPLELLRK